MLAWVQSIGQTKANPNPDPTARQDWPLEGTAVLGGEGAAERGPAGDEKCLRRAFSHFSFLLCSQIALD